MADFDFADDRPQPAANSIALDRVADRLRDREAEPRPRLARFHSRLALEHEARAGPPATAPDAQELRPLLQRDQSQRAALWEIASNGSGGQPLAALGAAPREHADAALGQHPLAEAVAALSDQPARLIGTFHDTSPSSCCAGPCGAPPVECTSARVARQPDADASAGRWKSPPLIGAGRLQVNAADRRRRASCDGDHGAPAHNHETGRSFSRRINSGPQVSRAGEGPFYFAATWIMKTSSGRSRMKLVIDRRRGHV